MWARINLIPLLQAEEDRDQVRRYWADQAREKALVGDNMRVYHKDRYAHIPPTLGVDDPPCNSGCFWMMYGTNLIDTALCDRLWLWRPRPRNK